MSKKKLVNTDSDSPDSDIFFGLPEPVINPTPPEDGMGDRIKKRREALGLNYEELARLTAIYDQWGNGLSGVMLARYEKGKDNKPVLPGARELRILCKSLNVSSEWLLFGKDEHNQSWVAIALAQEFINLLDAAERFKSLDPQMRRFDEEALKQKIANIRKSKK